MPRTLSANTLEMQARFREHKGGDRVDGAENMEVAMAATIFRDLQAAGYIPEGKVMADAPPCKHEDVEGTSYEAILVDLITDTDRDGKLDIDLDALVDTGIVGDPHACITGMTLVDTLEGRRDPLTDAFLREQSSSSDLSHCDFLCIGEDIITDKGEQVQDFSEHMVLSRNVEADISRVAGRLEHSTGAEVAEQAILQAQVLRDKGDPSSSRRLLGGTMDVLIRNGEFDAAETIANELKSDALKDETISTVSDHQLGWLNQRGRVGFFANGTTTYARPEKFQSTLGEVGDRRLAQIDLARTMSAAVELPAGEAFDPYEPDHVQAYLQTRVDAGDSVEQIGEAYQTYMQAFYAHSGRSVTWDKDVSVDDRPAQLAALFEAQPHELGGRKIIDCEGYSFMTERVIGGLEHADGDPVFDVRYMATSTHIIGGAFAKDGSGGFSVNNDTVTHLPASESGYSEQDRIDHMRSDIDAEQRLKIWYGEHASDCDYTFGTQL